MGEDIENENAFGSVVDPRDQPVIIPVYVEDGPPANNIGVSEITLRLGQRTPVGSPGNAIPVHQRYQRVVMPFRKFENRWFTDDPQPRVYKM
jgi:hypothetical protein